MVHTLTFTDEEMELIARYFPWCMAFANHEDNLGLVGIWDQIVVVVEEAEAHAETNSH